MLFAGILATEATLTTFLIDSAYADPGNGKGGGNGGGNGNGNGNGGNNAGGNGNSNAGGNSAAHGNGASSTSNSSSSAGSSTSATEIADPSSVLSLRESGLIQPLDALYDVAEQQLDCEVIDAKLMVDNRQRLTYDLRVVTEDGHVRTARYDAGTLALLSLDDQPVE